MSIICPRELRNAFAHQDVKIESDGTVIILKTGKKFKLEDLDHKIKIITKLIKNFSNNLKIYRS